MSRLLSIVINWLILCSTTTTAVKQPGNCPNVPSTQHDCINLHSGLSIVLGIPFTTETPSNFFVEISPQYDHNVEINFNITEDGKIKDAGVFIRDCHKYCQPHSIANGVVDTRNQTISLNTTVYGNTTGSLNSSSTKPLDCRKSMMEEIRLYCDNDFVIIYSCVDLTHNSEHDEAMFLLVSKKDREFYVNNYTAHNNFMAALRPRRKGIMYTEQLIIPKFDWKDRTNNDFAKKEIILFPCVTFNGGEIVFILSGTAILIFIIVVLLWYGQKGV